MKWVLLKFALQGGIHPDYTGEFLFRNGDQDYKKNLFRNMHIHGFTLTLEIWQGAETIGKSVEEYLIQSKRCRIKYFTWNCS
jgi:2-iminoacetate synthase ThiH